MAGQREMDEFVNWDHAADTSGHPTFEGHDPSLGINLALENALDDEFGFFALQRFTGDVAPPAIDSTKDGLGTGLSVNDNCLDTPSFPCADCASAGYQCKTIREGKHTGYCTSCVALGFLCSFAGISATPAFSEPVALEQPSWATRLEEQACLNFQVDNEPDKPANAYNHDVRDVPEPAPASTSLAIAAPQPVNPSLGQQIPTPIGKIGARLSRESIRVLRQWLLTHTRHPYPSDEEKDMLQRQTGLTKTQITNWLANARRRHKIVPPRATSPHVGNSIPLDVPVRKGTPALETMNPLQRWVDSPPEHEPASALDIARAVTASTVSSSERASPFSLGYTDDGSGRSIHESSASSVGTSQSSGGSHGSVYSHASRKSLGSFGSFSRSHRRRRRRNAPKRTDAVRTSLAPDPKTYQCTFCTESFRTKHDWQRHEKSLHLSLERWVCSNLGPRAMKTDINKLACVFCGEPEPSDAHIESHNYSTCFEKPLDARTFYRKDHLNQHLKLVHDSKFVDWSMKHWKVATPEIRSRCGFCGVVMDTWSIRVDHLAEHFKMGYGMEDWKGDWGFEDPVLDLVENSIPPYLIHNERHSPFPFEASGSPPETPRNAYELIKLELDFYMSRNTDPAAATDDRLQLEACRVVFASEVLCLQGVGSIVSWLRDLIMSSEELAHQAKFGPVRAQAENRLAVLKINGKDNLFEACPLERELQEFVRAKVLLGLTAMDDELQEEACCLVGKMEEVSTHPSESVANWLIRRIKSSTEWLAPFRQRAHIPRSEDVGDLRQRSTDKSKIDSTIYNYSRLELELSEYMDVQRRLGIEPSDADLQRQARIIIYEIEDGWNQTAADNTIWLAAFRQRHSGRSPEASGGPTPPQALGLQPTPPLQGPQSGFNVVTGGYYSPSPKQVEPGKLFLNDANCYRRLADELGRWVASVMSPNNPNRRVPTDEELQHQARWILYDDDDPWNQTAADNAEWRQRFKVDVGIIKGGTGLPPIDNWDVRQGGSGFAPPYAYPGGGANQTAAARRLFGSCGSKTADQLVDTLSSWYPAPARVFCSRELEEGLAGLVRHKAQCGVFPTDEELRARGRVILGSGTTAADDPALLEEFKAMMREELGAGGGSGPGAPGVVAGGGGFSAMMGVVGGDGTGTGTGMGDVGPGTGLLGDMSEMLAQDIDFDFMFDTQDTTMENGGRI